MCTCVLCCELTSCLYIYIYIYICTVWIVVANWLPCDSAEDENMYYAHMTTVVTIDIATNTTTVSEDVGVVTVCVQLTGSADTAIAAHLRTAHGSASAGDYETEVVSFHWVPRSTEPQCANFTITDDSVLENVEEFYVELSVPDDNPLIEPGANSTLTVIITDNDCKPDL